MRKTTIYAPRIQGDLSLRKEPSRLDGYGAQAWARMDFPGFRLPGQSDQLVTAQSETQKFEVGTRRIEYGRKFRYSKAGEEITAATNSRLLANGNYAPGVAGHLNEDGFNGNPVADALEGALYIDLDEGAAGRAANFFQGAYLQSLPAADPITGYYVVASDVSTATYTRVYLDHPLVQDILTTSYVGICACPYSKVIQGDSGIVPAGFRSFTGLPLCNVDDGHFFWQQTGGPAWIIPGSWTDDRLPGRAVDMREVFVAQDGAIACAWSLDPSAGYQRVGYLIDATLTGYGSVFIMLQLDS